MGNQSSAAPPVPEGSITFDSLQQILAAVGPSQREAQGTAHLMSHQANYPLPDPPSSQSAHFGRPLQGQQQQSWPAVDRSQQHQSALHQQLGNPVQSSYRPETLPAPHLRPSAGFQHPPSALPWQPVTRTDSSGQAQALQQTHSQIPAAQRAQNMSWTQQWRPENQDQRFSHPLKMENGVGQGSGRWEGMSNWQPGGEFDDGRPTQLPRPIQEDADPMSHGDPQPSMGANDQHRLQATNSFAPWTM